MPDTDIESLQKTFAGIAASLGSLPLNFLETCETACKGMLYQPEVWDAVTEVADRLLADKTLSGANIREIVRCRANKYFMSERQQMELTIAMARATSGNEPPKEFIQALEQAQTKEVAA